MDDIENHINEFLEEEREGEENEESIGEDNGNDA